MEVLVFGEAKNPVKAVKDAVVDKTKNIDADEIVKQAVKLPIVRVNRSNFLRKELRKYYPEKVEIKEEDHNVKGISSIFFSNRNNGRLVCATMIKYLSGCTYSINEISQVLFMTIIMEGIT